MNLNDALSERIDINDVKVLCNMATNSDSIKSNIYKLAFDSNERASINALWILSHLAATETSWLYSRQNQLIDAVLKETNSTTKRRLLLNVLEHQDFTKENLRTDFLDFCLSRITSAIEPYAIRALSMKLAFKQSIYFDELINELETLLDELSHEPLSPGLISARRQVLDKIRILKKAKRQKVQQSV